MDWRRAHSAHSFASIVNNGERINEFAILLSRLYDLMFSSFLSLFLSWLFYSRDRFCLLSSLHLGGSRLILLLDLEAWPGTASNLITDHVELFFFFFFFSSSFFFVFFFFLAVPTLQQAQPNQRVSSLYGWIVKTRSANSIVPFFLHLSRAPRRESTLYYITLNPFDFDES